MNLDIDTPNNFDIEEYSNSIGLGGSDWIGAGESGAAREQAMSHEYCGRKPGVFASKARLKRWEDCVRESLKLIRDNVQAQTEAQKQLALAQLKQFEIQQKMLQDSNKDEKKGLTTPQIIGISLGSIGLLTIIILLAKK